MTLEPSMIAVEERLQRLASAMPAPDADAGWAALSALLDPPAATVIPLRKRSSRRPIALLAAAAILVAGGAFAAVRQHAQQRAAPSPPTQLPTVAAAGPHVHAPFSRPHTLPSTTDGHGSSEPGLGTAPVGSTKHETQSTESQRDRQGHPKPHDDPNDLDQGTGNDGMHDDNGAGNDGAEGSRTRGQGHGNGHGKPAQPKADTHGHASDHGEGHGNGHGHST
jgi:hypothetical protein